MCQRAGYKEEMEQERLHALSEDRLLDGKIRLLQPVDGFRAAIDPILLAATVPSGVRSVLDAGCGSGAASLCLAWRNSDCHITGLDIQPDLTSLYERNALLNGMGKRMASITADIADLPPFACAEKFDCVMTNPPFLPETRGNISPVAARARSHVENEADLDCWLTSCLRMLKPRGTLCLIHRSDRMDLIMKCLNGAVGGILLFPLWPKKNRPAKRILICGRKGIATPATVHPGLVLHEDDGRYTTEANDILRNGLGLEISP